MAGIFLAGQVSVAATSAITICKPTRPCDGFSRSRGSGTGPGFVEQLEAALKKLPMITALFFSVLISLGASARATVLNSAIMATANRTDIGRYVMATLLFEPAQRGILHQLPNKKTARRRPLC